MNHINSEDINELLEKWFNAKQNITSLEQQCEKYKKLADRIMNTKNTNTLSSNKFKVSRNKKTRSSLGKKDVPQNIWNSYSKTSTFNTFHLVQK
jgi:hypothetical protein